MTRRWILELGGTAVLTGFSGADLSAAESLPAGVYGPSLDHLAHALKRNAAPLDFGAPKFFSSESMDVLRRTIGAMLDWEPSKQPVPEMAAWVDLLLSEAAGVRNASRAVSPSHRDVAIAYEGNPDAFKHTDNANPDETFTLARFKNPSFLNAGRPEQIAMLESWEREGDASVIWLKHRVIEGFYTSREGLAELNFKGNAFYPESPGCGH